MGINEFAKIYVFEKLSIPDSIKNSCRNSGVAIEFVVDTLGVVKELKLKKSFSQNFDKLVFDNITTQVFDIITKSSGLWHSAEQNGKKVNQVFIISVPISKIEKNCAIYKDYVTKYTMFYEQGKYIESMRYSSMVIDLFPDDTAAIMMKAKNRIKLNDYNGACKDLKPLNTNEAIKLKEKIKCK